ncbi:hypothetical protein ACXN5S_12420 [Pseudoroseicyclus sp. H15]
MSDPRTFGAQANQPALWASCRKLKRFTRAELRKETGLGTWTVDTFVQRLLEAHTLKVAGMEGRAQILEVTDTEAYELAPAPREQSPKGNMWTAMRHLRSFTVLDVSANASTEEVHVSEVEAKSYCQALLRAGYLRVINTEVPGRRRASYRLIRNSGPQPPAQRRVTGIYDPNAGEWTYLPEPTS